MAGTSAPQIPGCRDLTLVGERLARTLYTGHSARLGRAVTVTVYPPLADAASRQRFDDAATTAQRLGAHPSVLTIHDWGHAPDGRPWLVTDWMPAETVDTVLKSQGALDVERALHIGVLVAGALQTAHRAGIVHGDLSPDRLVFGARGEALVAEIGLAEFGSFPGLGALNNPIRYHAPPEALERTGITAASDIYSLATTVYALLAGRAPHEKPADITDSNASLLLRILQIEVPAIDRPDLPAGVDEVLRSGLSHTADKRPTQVIELAWALQDVQRRAGLVVTEPVVLDLDDLRAGPAVPTAVSPTAADPAPAPSPVIGPPLPAWAPNAGSVEAAPAAVGSPMLDPAPVPPDLDTLPAWYTDPLPNGPGSAPAADLVYLFSDTPPDLADRELDPHGGPGADEGSDTGWLNGHDVRGSNGSKGHARPEHGDHSDSPMPLGLDHDLGPVARPPIDVSRLGEALGPPPLLPRVPGGGADDRPARSMPASSDEPAGSSPRALDRPPSTSPTRLPSRYEIEQGTRTHEGGTPSTRPASRVPAATPAEPMLRRATVPPADSSTRLGSASKRAREARVTERRPKSPDVDGGFTGGPLLDTPTDTSRGATGPPALPVIVLIAIVVALTIGVAYMIATGDDPADPVSTDELRSNASALADDAAAGETSTPPTGLVATETAAGVELAWDGTVGTGYVVRVLSADEAPRPLPATAATTIVVTSADIESTTGYCFDVSIAAAGAGSGAAESPAPAPSAPACIRGATADSVRTQ